MNNHPINKNDEVDLKELFQALWNGKIYIFLFCFFAVFFASMYLQDASRVYLVEFRLKPVGVDQQKSALPSNLGGFAKLAGIQVPTNSSNDFLIFKELIFSNEVSKIIIKNKKLIKEIYEDEWNPSLNSFSEPPKSEFRKHIASFKKILTGNDVKYIPPNSKRLSVYISEEIAINQDKKTGFLTIKSQSSNPEMLLSLISMVIETSDLIMRQRYINFSKEPLAFYKEKLRTARSREHREALAGLISKEEQKLMFASQGKYFTAEPYMDPTISLYPIAPKPKQTLLLSLVFGFFLGCTIVLLRSAVMKVKK